MSSLLRSVGTPAGYFVMSAETILDGSGHGFYELVSDATYNNNGTVNVAAKVKFNSLLKDDLFDGNAAKSGTGGVVTLKDLGKTIYGANVYQSNGTTLQGSSDMRKVAIASGDKAGANLNNSFYVTLGSNLRNSTPSTTPGYLSTTLKPSVALVGKHL